MVTRKEIISECQANIKKAQVELSELETKHTAFKAEDEAEEKRNNKLMELWDKEEKINKQALKGNWENNENRHRGILPNRIKKLFNIKDSESNYSQDYHLIKNALYELEREAREKIEDSKEYKELKAEQEALTSNTSQEHDKLHEKIEELKYTIKWNTDKIKQVSTRGGLIEVCKWRAEQRRLEAEKKAREQKVAECKKKIQEAKPQTEETLKSLFGDDEK